jgi:hypothetical protein
MVVEIVGAGERADEEGTAAELAGVVAATAARHSKKPRGGDGGGVGGGAMPYDQN